MNKILLIVLFAFFSCNSPNGIKKIYNNNYTELNLYIIDGCEYIGKLYGGNTDVLTHKGNCKNHKTTKNGTKNSAKQPITCNAFY